MINDMQIQHVMKAEWLHKNFHEGEMEKCIHLPCKMAVVIKGHLNVAADDGQPCEVCHAPYPAHFVLCPRARRSSAHTG